MNSYRSEDLNAGQSYHVMELRNTLRTAFFGVLLLKQISWLKSKCFLGTSYLGPRLVLVILMNNVRIHLSLELKFIGDGTGIDIYSTTIPLFAGRGSYYLRNYRHG
jgi:hypothetical protein